MGRRAVYVVPFLIERFFAEGLEAFDPVSPLRDVRVLDAYYGDRPGVAGDPVLQLLIESPDLPGGDGRTLFDVDRLDVVLMRRAAKPPTGPEPDVEDDRDGEVPGA